MCGRFTLTRPVDEITRHFGVKGTVELRARYNIAPTQEIAVVRGDGERELIPMRWGLIPRWSRDGVMKSLLINARAETLTEKPAFRESVKTRRCLIPADGFYEWAHAGKKKQPWHLYWRGPQRGCTARPAYAQARPTDSSLLGFAGLWDVWRGGEGQVIESCTIITTAANAAVAKLHDRMPAIIPPAQYDAWLGADVGEALALLEPYPAEAMRMYPVSGLVSRTENDTPACLDPLEASEGPPPLLRM
jgi:putative SOS response-associated peptidase YedK